MTDSSKSILKTPRRDDLNLTRIVNKAGFSISFLPSGAVFAIEDTRDSARIMVNQALASPIAGGMGRLYLRIDGAEPMILPIIGPEAECRFGGTNDRAVWEGEQFGVRHRVDLWLHPDLNLWLWMVEIANRRDNELACDAVFIQDLGLGDPGFLMNNEAYASQYLDHHVAQHPRTGFVLMSRQNLSQGGAHPWAAHGCLEGAAGFATDFSQLMGPAHRDADHFNISFGTDLPSVRLQYESACAALQSRSIRLMPRARGGWGFFGYYVHDHPAASSDADLAFLDVIDRARGDWSSHTISLSVPVRSILQRAPSAVANALDSKTIESHYRRRIHVEMIEGQVFSFFIEGNSHNRHVVLRDKEKAVLRRHGALLISIENMLPTERTVSVTCWMHGVFGAQLTIGNTSFHKLFSVSRDPYNITRGSGLRILVETKGEWRLLTVPSAFEMGLSDCRWIYHLDEQVITVSAMVSGHEPAVQWRVTAEGERCRFLAFGHLVLGEHEFGHSSSVEIDIRKKSFTFRPDPEGMWCSKYPEAVYHLTISTPECVETVGGDELLYIDGKRRSGGFAVMRTYPTNEFVFGVVGSLSDSETADMLAAKFTGVVDQETMLASSRQYWANLTRNVHIESPNASKGAKAVDTIFPWLAHDAMVHLRAPHGLEQYTGAAWGTRDVCQGPMELLLSLEHDEAAKEILRVVFAEQYEKRGDWPQWFMLEPYSTIRDPEAHGDVIIWPLKALCDYVEGTGDVSILEEPIAWRRDDTMEKSIGADPIAIHVEKLVSTVRQRFIPNTHLIRYGNGDWNDSLQPVDPAKRDWMASSWTNALLYQQLCRYAKILVRVGRRNEADEHEHLAAAIRRDFDRFLICDDAVAGYAVFRPEGGVPELLLHPSDSQTGLSFSLLPMTRGIIGGIFSQKRARRHLGLIRRHLLFPDGARLMDKPIAYHGGPETVFRRAESAAFFGREVGLLYVHSHLRYAEAMSALGKAKALWDALLVVNPIAVTERLPHASLRQRNAYFSSSDAAFSDRYEASAEWSRVRAKTIAVEGGWRIYSSGPGLYVNMLIQHLFGLRRDFGKRIAKPCLPASQKRLSLVWPSRLGPPMAGD